MTSIGIIAHIDRLTQSEQLAHQVDAEYVSIDDGTLGAGGNHRKVWQHLAQQNTAWGCAIEDDAQPIPGFRDQLDQVLAVAPSPVVGLYLGTGRPAHWQQAIHQATAKADREHAHWIIARRQLFGVGIAIHTTLIDNMLAHTATTNEPIDQAIRTWADHNGHHIAFTWPSHLDHTDSQPVAEHRWTQPIAVATKPRKAWRVGTREHWTSRAVNLA